MNLRLRLIVVFFLLSVVPLGAVTYYTYTNNRKAVREAAEHEAAALATELSQRMQLVTAQLSLRVGRLMDLSAAQAAAQAPPPAPAAPVIADPPLPADPPAPPAPIAAAAEAVQTAAIGAEQAGDVMGELSLLLNNVEVFDPRGRGRNPGRGRNGGPSGDGVGRGDGAAFRPSPEEARGRRGRGAPGPGDTDGSPVAPDAPGNPAAGDLSDADADRIRIDMRPIWRDVVQQFVPEGRLDQLSPEERQRVFAEVNQRMTGIRQGIQIVQQTVAEHAADASARAQTATAGNVTGRGTAPAPAPAPRSAPASSTTASTGGTVQRRAALSGSRLGVSLERDGEVVSEASAEINLPNLLATVFTTTRRESGEVPFAVSPDGQLYTPTEADRATVQSIGSVATQPGASPSTDLLSDWIVVTTGDPTGSELKFGIARPIGAALDELRRGAARNAAFGLAFIALALVGIVPLASGLTRNLSNLSEGVRRLASGDYSARVVVRSRDEAGRLAEAFNQMAADVERHQRAAVEQERIRRELELGRQIQHDMLPQAPLKFGLTEVKGVSVPAREVGGDFFNYFRLNDGTVALLVGDVSGKGVGAALLMANIQAALRTRLSLGQDLASLAQELDVDIERSTPGPVYATLFVGIFDPDTRRLRCVNAGHNPQYVLRHHGGLERMESTGRPIGLFAGGGYTEQQIVLDAGDVIFFYTDGCVEAENAEGDMFGAPRLEDALVAAAGGNADEVLVSVENAVSAFRAGADLQDDATMMVVKVG